MGRKRQREIVLAALAAALIATAAWRVLYTVSPTPAAGTVLSTSAAQEGEQARDKRALAGVDLDALQAERPEPEAHQRNPFRFKPLPPPPPVSAVEQAASGETAPVEPQAPPQIPLKFIGLMNQTDSKVERVAILSDSRGVYFGREGETIEGRYRILKIGVESIDLAYLDGRGLQTIRLTGQ